MPILITAPLMLLCMQKEEHPPKNSIIEKRLVSSDKKHTVEIWRSKSGGASSYLLSGKSREPLKVNDYSFTTTAEFSPSARYLVYQEKWGTGGLWGGFIYNLKTRKEDIHNLPTFS